MLAHVANTPIGDILAMPYSVFEGFWNQLPWLIATVKSHAIGVISYPHADANWQAKFDDSLRQYTDTRTDAQKWREGIAALKGALGNG